jgi:uncharacterized protein YjbI with pentapeptide repeats
MIANFSLFQRLQSRMVAIALTLFLVWTLLLGLSTPVYAAASAAASGNPLAEEGGSLAGRDLTGSQMSTEEFANVNLDGTNLSRSNLIGTVFSTSTLNGTIFRGADLTQTMMDQVRLIDVDFSDAVLEDAMLLRTEFRNVKIDGADFTNAILNAFQIKQLCRIATGTNSKTGVDTRESLGCR